MKFFQRLFRHAALAAAAAAVLLSTLIPTAPVLAAEACEPGQVVAAYYNNGPDGWVEVAARCEDGPVEGTFTRDYSLEGSLPEGVDPANFRVTFSGTLAPATAGWHAVSGTGAQFSLDGLGAAPYLFLNESNALAVIYEQGEAPGFAVTVTPVAACEAGQEPAVERAGGLGEREADSVTCAPATAPVEPPAEPPAPPVTVTAAAAGEVQATYYKWETDKWVEAAKRNEPGPAGGSFSRDYTVAGSLPEGVDPAKFRVTFTGTLEPAAPGWHQVSVTGGLSYDIDGLGTAPFLNLGDSNSFAASFEGTAFTLGYSAVAACTADQMHAVYRTAADGERQARLVRCEAGPTEARFERTSFPDMGTGPWTAVYTGQAAFGEDGWYQFSAKTRPGDTLSATVGTDEVVRTGDEGGYIEVGGGQPLTVQYAHDGSGSPHLELTWQQVRCDTGLYLAAYYDGNNHKGRAGVVRCEPRPHEVAMDSAKSAKWTGRVYFEGGTFGFTGTDGGQFSLDGGGFTPLNGGPVAVGEGLHTFSITSAPGSTTFSAGGSRQESGWTLPLCPDGLYARKQSGLPLTCEAAPVAPGDGATAQYTARLWFQGADYKVTTSNASSLTIGGAPVTDSATLREGAHDVSFTANGSEAVSLSFLVMGGCPEGTFRSRYQSGGNTLFGACEPRPEYAWGSSRPPGILGDFGAEWSGLVPLSEAGLYTFATNGEFTLRKPNDDGVPQSVQVYDLLPHQYQMELRYQGTGSGTAVGLNWAAPSGATAPACPDGFYRADYGNLATCEREPYLTHARSWGATSATWTGQMLLNPGEHSLYLSVAGNARLYVDGALAADVAAAEGIHTEAVLWDMARGWHQIRLEYTGGTGEMDFVRLQRREAIPAPAGGVCPAGWFTVQWYNGSNLSGSPAAVTCEGGLPDRFEGLTPPAVITGSDWSARWTGSVDFPAGRYRFQILSRNAVRVLVGGVPVVEESISLWTPGIHNTDAEVSLSGGPSTVVVEYATNPARAPGVDPAPVAGAGLRVRWTAAGAPALIGAGFSSANTLQLRYDSALDNQAVPGHTSFQVTSLRTGAALATTGLSVSANLATLTLAAPVPDGESVIVRYAPQTAGALRGLTAPMVPLEDQVAGKSPTIGGNAWQVDLGDVYRLPELKLVGEAACCDSFHVMFSLDGQSWNTIYTHAGGALMGDGRPYLRLQPSGGAARYIRLESVSGGAAPAVAQVQAWGAHAGNPAAPPSPLTGTNPINVALAGTASAGPAADASHPAALGVNGFTTKRIEAGQDVVDYFQATGTDPYWTVNLGGEYLLSSIRVYNRADCCYTAAEGFILETSVDGATWEAVSHSGEIFGGPYTPYIRVDLPERKAAYVRVRLEGADRTLHLAEVQVYGVPAVASLIVRNDLATPELLTAEGAPRIEVIDDVVILRYNKPMDSASVPSPADFTVTVDGAAYTPSSVQIFGPDVSLYLPVRTDPTMIVTLKYTPGASSPRLQDRTGNQAAAIGFTEARYLAVVPVNWALNKPVATGGTVEAAHPAGLGVNGVRYFTGPAAGPRVYDYFSITGTDPYWQVDLKDVLSLSRIRIFNRFDGGWSEAGGLRVQISVDGTSWRTVYVNNQQRLPSPIFGDVEGEFLAVDLGYDNARYVRLSLPGAATLSLAEVQVYGLPAIQSFNLARLRPATLTGGVGTYTQWAGLHLGEQPPAGIAYADEAYNPTRASDGDSTTALAMTAAGGESLWQVDFRRTYALSRINLTVDTTDVAVSASLDGITWTDLFTGANQLQEGGLISLTVPLTEARFLRVRSSQAAWKLYEVEALGFPLGDLEEERPLANLSQRKPASLLAAAGAYAQWEDRYLSAPGSPTGTPAQSPANAVDGNPATYADLQPMAAADSGCNCRAAWTVDLQGAHAVTRLAVQFATDADAESFRTAGRIALSTDGATWMPVAFSDLALVDSRTHSLVLPLPGTAARYVRLASDGALRLYEVEVYGYQPQLDR